MKKLAMAVSVVALAVAASVSMAGPGGGFGPGPGYGMGGGFGRGGGFGMSLLTPEEQAKFRDAMHEMKTVAECEAVVAQRHQLVTERAKEKGVTLPAAPRGNMCERMKARGFIS